MQQSTSQAIPPLRVLLIAPENELSKDMRSMLSRLSVNSIQFATSAQEARVSLEENVTLERSAYDLLLTSSPADEVKSIARTVRSVGIYRTLPIVAFLPEESDESREQLADVGVNAAVTLQQQPNTLEDTLTKTIEFWSLTRPIGS